MVRTADRQAGSAYRQSGAETAAQVPRVDAHSLKLWVMLRLGDGWDGTCGQFPTRSFNFSKKLSTRINWLPSAATFRSITNRRCRRRSFHWGPRPLSLRRGCEIADRLRKQTPQAPSERRGVCSIGPTGSVMQAQLPEVVPLHAMCASILRADGDAPVPRIHVVGAGQLEGATVHKLHSGAVAPLRDGSDLAELDGEIDAFVVAVQHLPGVLLIVVPPDVTRKLLTRLGDHGATDGAATVELLVGGLDRSPAEVHLGEVLPADLDLTQRRVGNREFRGSSVRRRLSP